MSKKAHSLLLCGLFLGNGCVCSATLVSIEAKSCGPSHMESSECEEYASVHLTLCPATLNFLNAELPVVWRF